MHPVRPLAMGMGVPGSTPNGSPSGLAHFRDSEFEIVFPLVPLWVALLWVGLHSNQPAFMGEPDDDDPTQHAKGRTGDYPGPRKGATTRRNVTQGGGVPDMELLGAWMGGLVGEGGILGWLGSIPHWSPSPSAARMLWGSAFHAARPIVAGTPPRPAQPMPDNNPVKEGTLGSSTTVSNATRGLFSAFSLLRAPVAPWDAPGRGSSHCIFWFQI